MAICGYHLRCLNYRKKCLGCSYQQKNAAENYLNDVLKVWRNGKEEVCAIKPFLPAEAVFAIV
jgi:hypothetical protein